MRARFMGLGFVAFAALILQSTNVNGDEPTPMIHIACLPDVSFFKLETFGLYNIPEMPKALQASSNVYTLREFVAAAPIRCLVRSGVLQVDVVRYHVPVDTGMCGGDESASLSIKLNGKEIDQIENTHSGCVEFGFYGHQIRVTQYQMTHCRTDFDEFELSVRKSGPQTVATSCNTIALRH